MFVVCRVRSGLCQELIPPSHESYRVRVSLTVCDLETSKRGGLGPIWDVAPQKETTVPTPRFLFRVNLSVIYMTFVLVCLSVHTDKIF